jgi:diguanylate cyclase (GGDEF)-like protein
MPFDELTGLYTRDHFLTQLVAATRERCRQDGVEAALVLCDFDELMRFNDTFGHPEGDRILSEFARRLHGLAEDGSAVARVGGDVFAVLLAPPSGRDDAERLAEKLRASLKGDPIAAREDTSHELPLTVSIGLAVVNAETTPDAALAAADEGVYQARVARVERRRAAAAE